MCLFYRFEHDGCKESWPKAKLLIKTYMLGTLCKSEKTRMLYTPFSKAFHNRLHEEFCSTLVPVFGMNSEGAKKTNATPVAGKVGTYQLTIDFCSKSSIRIGF